MGKDTLKANDYEKFILKKSKAPIVILDAEDLTIRKMNESAEEFFLQAKDFRGKITDIFNIKDEEGEEINEEILKTEVSDLNLSFEDKGNKTIVDKDLKEEGEIDQKIKRVGLNISRIRDSLFLEVTDKKEQLEIEEALREQIKELSGQVYELTEELKELGIVVENSRDGYYVYDLEENKYDTISPSVAKILNYTMDEFKEIQQDAGITTLVDDKDKKTFIKHWRDEKFSGNTEGQIDFRMHIKENGSIWVEDKYTIIRNKNGEAIKIIGNVRDINKGKKTDEALERIGGALRHDVTNHFSVIKSATKLYVREVEAGATQEKLLKRVEDIRDRALVGISTVDHMRKAIQRLRAKEGLTIMDLQEVATKICKNHSNNIEVDISDMKKINILGDTMIYSVINNLIDNAIRHGKASKIKLSIEGSMKKDYITLKVNNNGSKISEEILDKIFEKGYTHGESGNTGEGLYHIKKTIEEDYAGSVLVKNEEEGVTFSIQLKRIKI